MKKSFVLLGIILCLPFTGFAQKASCRLSGNGDTLELYNGQLSICIDLKRVSYKITDRAAGLTVFEDARIAPDFWNEKSRDTDLLGKSDVKWEKREIETAELKGMRVELEIHNYRRMDLPVYLFSFTLPDKGSWTSFQTGMKNTSGHPCRLMQFYPFCKADLFPGKQADGIQTLDGGAGNEMTCVKGKESRESCNNLLLTAKVNGQRYSMVWGGLKYENFYAVSCYDAVKNTISLKMSDPVGRLVANNVTFWNPDTYYLGMSASDPFEEAERYGRQLREANHANPKIYNFVKLCGWAVGALSHQGNVNNSAALVKEMDAANESGLTRYARAGIRIVPDRYCYINGDTEQGWWDDEHWAKYGHLVPPYETNAKWCNAIKQRGGIPITYLQTNIPSCDFAKSHPEWMLHNDISGIDRYYSHVAPAIRYDYTDPGFMAYMTDVWKRLRTDGIQGVFFDYPETSWITGGGFEDSLATTSSAYRNIFRLARQGMGPEAYFSERNIGESKRPMLDITAGLVDYQRTTWDTNKFKAGYVSKCGLRWYKGRMVFNYYQDSKEISRLSTGMRQSLLTMTTMTSGMLELATSFKMLTPEMVHDLSRIYPMYDGKKSPRPIDAFTGVNDPMVYDLELTPAYHVLTLFNALEQEHEVSVSLQDERTEGGLALDPESEYYAYDFWNDRLAGRFSGKDRISRKLSPLTCAVYALRKVEGNPQVIATNRHILQGWMDMKEVEWNCTENELSATSDVIGGEVYRITVALNGFRAIRLKSETGRKIHTAIKDSPAGAGYRILEISCPDTGPVKWKLKCRR